jgi:hypothetical protein
MHCGNVDAFHGGVARRAYRHASVLKNAALVMDVVPSKRGTVARSGKN